MDRLAGMLHLCRKAGKLLIGQKAVMSLKSGEDRCLVLIASDAGGALRRKWKDSGALTVEWSSQRIGEILGREKISVLGICGDSFADQIENILESEKLLVV